MSMYSSNASVTVPAARFRTGSAVVAARPGGVRSGSSIAARPRAAAIGLPATRLPARSVAKPRAISSDTEAAALAPPAAADGPTACCRAALWPPVSDTMTAFSEADTGAPARSTRTAAGGGGVPAGDGGRSAAGGGATATTRAAGAAAAAASACTCSSNRTVSVPVPRSSLADSGAGPVSSGTTRAAPSAIPPYRLPDRSSIAAVCPTIVMFEAAAAAALAF